MNRSNSHCNSPELLSACNGNAPVQVRHGEHCACFWCLVGHK